MSDVDTARVLHVDDEPDFAEMAAAFLEREDNRLSVKTVSSVDEGLDYLQETDIDCIVSDYDMPGQNGIEFLKTVRDDHPELPFILYTGKGSEEIASEAISAGVTDYLQKGSETSQYTVLANRILNAVEQYRARREAEKTQQRLREIAENIPDCVWMFDRDWQETVFISGYEDLWGRPKETLEENPQAFLNSVHPDDREFVEESVERVLGGEPTDIEYRILKDEETRWVRVKRQPIFDDEGTVVRIAGFTRDITDRKDREHELERYETIIEALGDPIYALDTDGCFVFVNEAFVKQIGYEYEELIGQHTSIMLSETDVERGRDIIRELLSTDDKRTATWEMTSITADGDRFPSENHLALLPSGEDGSFRGTAGVIRNITDRKETEKELRRYRAIVESVSDAVYAVDHEGRLRYVNDQYAELKGMAREELLGTISHRWIDDEVLTRIKGLIEELESEERDVVTIEYESRTSDRGSVLVENQFTTIEFPDGSRGRVGVIRDIGERKERERMLQQLHTVSRDLLNADTKEDVAEIIVEAARDTFGYTNNGVRLVSEDGSELVPVSVTEGITDILGERPVYPVGEGTAGRAFASQDTLLYDDVREIEDGYDRGDARAGMYLPIGEHGTLSINDDEPGVFNETDVQLAETFAANAAVALDRIEQQQDLKRQNEQLEEFAGIVSHDLRNPLSVAEGRLELAREECESEHLDAVAGAHDRMGTLIDDLLKLAREGEDVAKPDLIDLGGLVENCWHNVETAEATLVADTERRIRADRRRLAQLLENLIRNAVEHGGEDVTITVGSIDDGFYIADDGPGIPAEEREQIFESGYTTSDENTGFGLAIVREIVEAHGWNVRVAESEAGGARFEITGVEFAER